MNDNVVPLRGGTFHPPAVIADDGNYIPSLPDDDTVKAMTGDRPLKAVIVITMNDLGQISDWVDGPTHLERLGILSTVLQMATFAGDPNIELDYDRD